MTASCMIDYAVHFNNTLVYIEAYMYLLVRLTGCDCSSVFEVMAVACVLQSRREYPHYSFIGAM